MRKRLKKIFINAENFNPLNNFAHRIQEVSEDIKDQLIQNLKNCKNLSSALNEFCIKRHSPVKTLGIFHPKEHPNLQRNVNSLPKDSLRTEIFDNFPSIKEEFQLEIEKFVSIIRGTLAI